MSVVSPALMHSKASTKMSRDWSCSTLWYLSSKGETPCAALATPMAQMVEQADLLDQPQRRIERQEVDQGAEPHAFGGARERPQIDARHRHHVERRGVVLGDVQAVDAGRLGGGGELQALVEELRERALAPLDVVEKSDFHGSPDVLMRVGGWEGLGPYRSRFRSQ